MSKNALHINDAAPLTVGKLITELCRWPDQAKIRLRCPDTGAELSVARIDSLALDLIDLELERVAEAAPVVPA